jgi:hypothetical protein
VGASLQWVRVFSGCQSLVGASVSECQFSVSASKAVRADGGAGMQIQKGASLQESAHAHSLWLTR